MIERYLITLGSVLLLALVFRLVERRYPAEQNQPRSAWLFNLAYTPFILAFALTFNLALAPFFSLALAVSGGGLLSPPSGDSLLAQVLFTLGYALVWDLSQYLLHRLQHAVPILWETHKFHHDETAVSSVTQARVHPTGYALTSLFFLPVLVLLGPQSPHFIVAFVMFTLWGFVNHANLRLSFGPLTPLIAGPQWHRIHHSVRAEHRDRNFAIMFPVIDMIFGTYYRPGKTEYPPTGLADGTTSSIQGATVAPFIGWYLILNRRRARN